MAEPEERKPSLPELSELEVPFQQTQKSEVIDMRNTEKAETFAFDQCSEEDLRTRVFIKQQATDDAFDAANSLVSKLNDTISSIGEGNREAFDILGGKEVKAWIDEIEALRKTSRDFQTWIGVAGATGSGKTSLLNALLDLPELLSSSSSEAATASLCQIAFNHDDTAGHEFRAEIVFRSREDVVRELTEIFRALEDRKELQNGKYNEDFEDETDRFEAEAEANKLIQVGFSKIRAVWGLEEHDVEEGNMTVDTVLQFNKKVLEAFGTTKLVHSANKDLFAQEIKPYLDSSQAHSAFSSHDGFSAWPLIQEVKLYVKADMLKHGMVLVDLPGLSDSAGGREEVAERNYQRLAITAIVTPVIRAVDEKTGVQLMSKWQEMCMQLDGTLNSKGYCVVLSKVDDIDCDAFYKATREAREDLILQEDVISVQELLAEINKSTKDIISHEKQCASLEKKLRRINERLETRELSVASFAGRSRASIYRREKLLIKREEYSGDIRSKKGIILQLKTSRTETEAQMAYLESRKTFQCIQLRNNRVRARIRRDHRGRRVSLVRGKSVDDDTIGIFPVCASAYRDLLKKQRPMKGFPSIEYTGIPLLRHWLDEAVLSRREEHLDSLLRTLKRLFHGFQRWSQDQTRRLVVFSHRHITEVLQNSHEKYLKKLSSEFISGHGRLEKLNPEGKTAEKRQIAKQKASAIASRWVFKNPNNTASTQRMVYSTYSAILRRQGGPYTNRLGITYNFPESLAAEFLELLLNDWRNILEVELPKIQGQMRGAIKTTWIQYLDEIKTQIGSISTDLLPYFRDPSGDIAGIEIEMDDKIRATLRGVEETTKGLHPKFLKALRAELRPIFEEALEIKGKGSFKRRQIYIRSGVEKKSSHTFGRSSDRMRKQFTATVNQLPTSFCEIGFWAVETVRKELDTWLKTLQPVNVENQSQQAALDEKTKLQRAVEKVVLDWGAHWRVPEKDARNAGVEPVGIPREFPKNSELFLHGAALGADDSEHDDEDTGDDSLDEMDLD